MRKRSKRVWKWLKRPLSLQLITARIRPGDILVEPFGQLRLDINRIHHPPDIVPLDNSQIVSQPGNKEHVRDPGAETAVSRGSVIIVLLWFLCGRR